MKRKSHLKETSLAEPCIQAAREEDCEHMLLLYTPYVLETAISFEMTPPSNKAFMQRFHRISLHYPWLVYKQEGKVIGYAYASSFNSREAYQYTCEASLYIDSSHRGRGIGTALYCALLAQLKNQGMRQVLAAVAQPNDASNQMHDRLGFSKAGVFKDVGYKFSTWHDVAWFQLNLTDFKKEKV